MSGQREQKRRRQIHARDDSASSVPFMKDSLCHEAASVNSVPFKKDSLSQDDQSPGVETLAYSRLNLPEDVWGHVHSLMRLRDSVCSARVCHTFLRSWRFHPKLTFTEEALGLKRSACQKNDIARAFTSRVDQILKNHSDTGVKTLKLVICDHYNVSTCHLNNWLQNAVMPGIEEVFLKLPTKFRAEYNFPCSVLTNGRGNSIRYFRLTDCAFRPTVGFNCLRSLTKLNLYQVRITGDEIWYLISSSFALEHLGLSHCNELICLKIPSWLERLRFLRVFHCKMLQVIESAAPNLSTFELLFGDPIQLTLGESSQLKNISMGFSYEPNIIGYALDKLPSTVPHLETLTLSSSCERVNTPIVADKFLHLKYLKISLAICDEAILPRYDYLLLALFLDASPALETFVLSVNLADMLHDTAFGETSYMRRIPEHKHNRLKKVQIDGFCSAKSMAELACHILENAISLKSLTLDTIYNLKGDGNISRCSGQNTGECILLDRNLIMEAHKALGVIRRYILQRVPCTVKLNVGEPCSRCHAIDVKLP